tara:strand:+ start:14881 stop:15072 length:192 start_codon:yes stop_codon:yes gene_type:complete
MAHSTNRLFSIICIAALALCAPIVAAVTAVANFLTGHFSPVDRSFHMTANPRSIIETRRMGLA